MDYSSPETSRQPIHMKDLVEISPFLYGSIFVVHLHSADALLHSEVVWDKA